VSSNERHGLILAGAVMKVSPEMDRFNSALRQILQVPKLELKRLLAEEKAAKSGKTKPGPKPKTSLSTSGHASDNAD
jgi:hypothetical protein